jgi:hypothetical protein
VVPAVVWFVPIAMLLIALLPLPIGFYTLLRLVVCAAAAYLAVEDYRARGSVGFWLVVLAGVALLFNPLTPIFLSRDQWAPIDVLGAVVFVLHWWRTRSRRAAEG